jgi:hypothetical protein
MHKKIVMLAAWASACALLAQESPTTPRAARGQILQGPVIELSKEHLTIVRWTANYPGGTGVQ